MIYVASFFNEWNLSCVRFGEALQKIVTVAAARAPSPPLASSDSVLASLALKHRFVECLGNGFRMEWAKALKRGHVRRRRSCLSFPRVHIQFALSYHVFSTLL